MADDFEDSGDPKEGEDAVDKEEKTGHRANSTSYKKGTSGNLSGRPKGSRNRKTIIAAAGNAKVTFNEGGKRVKKTKFEVSQIQLANQAARGDLKAIAMLLDYQMKFGLLSPDGDFGLPQLGLNDKVVMADIIRRIRASDPADDQPDPTSGRNNPPEDSETKNE